ncbi:MAG TPA: hypothetical protein VKY90_03500 [Candidatus Dormibacteraeota bacterium]|nr:hypothetical protein [Candidatus Dormibacteraeota bacterium]
MTRTRPPSPGAVRDRGLDRLRRWTVAVAAASAGLVGFFAVLAVNGFPGHPTGSGATSTAGSSSTSPASGPSSASAPAQGSSGATQPAQASSPSQPQPPPEGFFGQGGGGPMVVSGGS